MKLALALGLGLAASTVWGAGAPFPAANFPYFGKVQLTRPHVQSATNVAELKKEAADACRVTHRALYAVENYFDEIRELIGSKGVNFPILYNNREFYRRRLANRFNQCTTGTIRLNLHGRCATEQGTLAFVKVTFGFVSSTINICDEYFTGQKAARVETLVHEYGRLENIGDSPNFDTNNIYVWDAIVGRLAEDRTFQDLSDLKAKQP